MTRTLASFEWLNAVSQLGRASPSEYIAKLEQREKTGSGHGIAKVVSISTAPSFAMTSCRNGVAARRSEGLSVPAPIPVVRAVWSQ